MQHVADQTDSTLNKIKVYAQANTHRRLFTRVFYKDMDPESIRRCRDELTNRFQAFEIQSSIQTRVDLAAVRNTTNKILAGMEDHRSASDMNIRRQTVDSGALSPPPENQRPMSAPPTHKQFSALPSPSYTGHNPFSAMSHPDFPFNLPQRQSQPVFNVTTNSNFNAPNSNNYNSGTVSNQFNVGQDDYSTNVNNYTYDGGAFDRRMRRMERKMAQKVGSPR
ncbi:hypothetical protein BKA70DRAFT_49015 [Coprinopsis sp. MPI-PUGE-AT-0042]|nr:hypothetical protein BKA70DRAFT_49015 [Coprinopsis sp. MPI-PUGE-AT-0042]